MFRFKGLMAAFGLGCVGLLLFALNSGREADYLHLPSDKFADVILVADDEADRAFAYLVFPYGEAANPYDEGMAHYVEHLAWNSALKERDRTTAHSNAWTNTYTTGYWLEVEPSDLVAGLSRLVAVADPISLDPQFALEESDIVLREYDLRIAEWPLYAVGRETRVALFGNGGLSRAVIGSPEDIATFDLQTAKGLHRETHRLSSATLLVYGNLSPSDLTRAISQMDAAPDAGPALNSRPLVEYLAGTDTAEVTVSGLSQDTYIYRKLLPVAACDDPVSCDALVQLAATALDSTLPGGLAGPLRYNEFIARSYEFDIQMVADSYTQITFDAVPDDGVTLADLGSAFEAAFETTLKSGLSTETFERVKARSLSEFDSILDHEWQDENRRFLLAAMIEGRAPFGLNEQRDAIQAVDLNALNAFLKSLSRSGRTVVRLVSAER